MSYCFLQALTFVDPTPPATQSEANKENSAEGPKEPPVRLSLSTTKDGTTVIKPPDSASKAKGKKKDGSKDKGKKKAGSSSAKKLNTTIKIGVVPPIPPSGLTPGVSATVTSSEALFTPDPVAPKTPISTPKTTKTDSSTQKTKTKEGKTPKLPKIPKLSKSEKKEKGLSAKKKGTPSLSSSSSSSTALLPPSTPSSSSVASGGISLSDAAAKESRLKDLLLSQDKYKINVDGGASTQPVPKPSTTKSLRRELNFDISPDTNPDMLRMMFPPTDIFESLSSRENSPERLVIAEAEGRAREREEERRIRLQNIEDTINAVVRESVAMMDAADEAGGSKPVSDADLSPSKKRGRPPKKVKPSKGKQHFFSFFICFLFEFYAL